MIGIEKYNEYLANVERVRRETGEQLKEKEEANQRRILFLSEDKSKTSKAKIFTTLFLFAGAGIAYTLLKEYLDIKYLWIYFVVVAGIYIAFTCYEYYIAKQIKDLKAEYDATKNQEIKEKLEKVTNEIYNVTIYIICINEYYYDLVKLSGEELKNKWKEITNLKEEAIDYSMNNVVTTDKYQDYLEEWIKNHQK